jgi:DNA modification methylase
MDSSTYIPGEHLKEWKLDVVGKKDISKILEMIVWHYSLPGDGVTIVNSKDLPANYLGRSIHSSQLITRDGATGPFFSFRKFENSPFFHRYLHAPSSIDRKNILTRNTGKPTLTVYEGDCISALEKIPNESMDGAVTSPPYYNAREYSNWSNLYCYLYDMKLSAEGVWRVLKPGAYYLYNIFDYFDNDNIVAMSALGKRRICLGAYINQIFRHVGFRLETNIVWHKGEIEGKRNYNHGNRAPYYQLPLNTWEHILVFRKKGGDGRRLSFPGIIHCQPVKKWFNGENRHGHTAPFPEEIPQLLCARLPKGSEILDPYGGSFTTAISCQNTGQKCTLIELHGEYCDLGLRRMAEQQRQLSLFA